MKASGLKNGEKGSLDAQTHKKMSIHEEDKAHPKIYTKPIFTSGHKMVKAQPNFFLPDLPILRLERERFFLRNESKSFLPSELASSGFFCLLDLIGPPARLVKLFSLL